MGRTASQLIQLKICIKKPMQPSARILNDRSKPKRMSRRRDLVPRGSPMPNARQRLKKPKKSSWLKLKPSGINLKPAVVIIPCDSINARSKKKKKKKKKKSTLVLYPCLKKKKKKKKKS